MVIFPVIFVMNISPYELFIGIVASAGKKMTQFFMVSVWLVRQNSIAERKLHCDSEKDIYGLQRVAFGRVSTKEVTKTEEWIEGIKISE
jgi:hypothetical protein